MPAPFRISPLWPLLIAAALAACDTGEQGGNATANASNAAKPDAPALRLPKAIPTPAPELDRAALLAAAARAASAYATGEDDRATQAQLDGRRFTLKLRFGCGGPSQTGAMRWSYDEADQTLTVRATPDINRVAPTVDEGEEEGPVETVEGFWIPRPWILTDACPAEAAGDAAAAATQPTVGVAQYYTADDSRVHRRSGRAYEIVRRAEPAITPSGTGFTLVLRGRLRAWPEGGVIRCRGTGATARPACIISAELDRVAFESPETGLTLAEWSAG